MAVLVCVEKIKNLILLIANRLKCYKYVNCLTFAFKIASECKVLVHHIQKNR